MADYFTQFSCVLDVGTPDKAVAALDLFLRLREEDEASDDLEFSGFAVSLQDGPGSSVLWFHDDGQGDVEGVIRFVLRLAEALDLTGLWGFDYTHTCSRPGWKRSAAARMSSTWVRARASAGSAPMNG